MIRATPQPGFDALATRLAAMARALAEAQAAEAALTPRADPARWRRPGLLWPLFAKG